MKARLGGSTPYLVLCVLMTLCSTARADERVSFGVQAGVATPLSVPDTASFGPGASGSLSAAVSLDAVVSVGLRLEGGVLSDAPPPGNHLRDAGVGSWGAADLFLRLRPLAGLSSDGRRSTGLYLEVGAGGGITGGFVRPAFRASLGWGIPIGDVVFAPSVGVTHLLSWDEPLGGIGALVGNAGITLTFGDEERTAAQAAEASDRDGDGLLDADDFCPDEPEDADSFLDEDGCPDRDDDEDGIEDVSDACRLEPEDFDGDADEDGCPEEPATPSDRDGDGIVDALDACPDVPEVVNGVEDDDGCPDEGLVVLMGDRVVLDGRVLFDLDSAHVHRDARSILAAVVTLFETHPNWDRVRVEGHADERGSEEHNYALSERRAEAVRRALVSLGISPDRVEVGAYGESRPRDPGTTDSAHALNRRVEIVMIDDGTVPASAPRPEAPQGAIASIAGGS